MKKRSKILNQLLRPTLLVIGFLAIAIMVVMGVIFYNTFQNRAVNDSMSENALMANNVSGFMSEAYALSEELANDPDILSMDTNTQTPILEACVSRNEYLELLYIQDTTGMQTGRSSGELADRSSRWWFQQMIADKKPFVSQSYYSVNTGMPCASIFFPMYNANSDFIGVFATDIKLDSLVSLVTDYSDPAQDKTVFIIDGDGNVVAHPDKNYIEELYNYTNYTRTVSIKDDSGNVKTDADGNILTKEEPLTYSDSFKEMIANVISGQSGSDIVKMDGSNYYASYSPIVMDGESATWSVITLQKKGTLMSPIYMVLAIAMAISVIVLVAAILIITVVTRRITRPIVSITGVIGNASEGDFSVKADTDNNTEVGVLAEGFNHMTDKVSNVLHGVVSILVDVKGSAQTLSGLSEESAGVMSDMQNIADGAVKQSEDTQNVVALTRRLENCHEQLQDMSRQLTEEIRGTKGQSDAGLHSVNELKKRNEESIEAVNSSYEKVINLNESSKKIGEIIKEINDISSETSLLALNASIEAARAGEHGRGFAVVAEEVSTLAANSAVATSNIENIVSSLQNDITVIVQEIDSIKEVFNAQLDAVEMVGESFSSFRESSNATLATVENVGELIHTVEEVNHEVVESMDNIYKISQVTEENAKEAASRMMKQKEEIFEIAQKVDSMNEASELLENEMSKFTL